MDNLTIDNLAIPARLTRPLNYECPVTLLSVIVPAHTLISVDVEASIAMVNGYHIDISPHEYLLITQ